MNYLRVDGVKRLFRPLFNFAIAICLLTVLTLLFCACNDETDTADDDVATVPESIVFVVNNGENDVICEVNDSVPFMTKSGRYISAWCTDEALENIVSFSDIGELFEAGKLSPSSDGKYRLYAKWESLKTLSGISMEDISFIYDGKEHNPMPKNLPSGADVEFSSEKERINAGTYEVTAAVSAYGYKTLYLTCTLTIQKARYDMSGISFEGNSVVWSGNSNSLQICGNLPEGVTVSYENNGHTDVGVYEVIAHFTVDENHEPVPDMKATLTVSEKTYVITFVEENGDTHSDTIAHGESTDKFPLPYEKRGYIGSWSEIDFDNAENGITVNAVYTLAEYDITYECNGGSVDNSVDLKYTVNEEVTLPIPTREYYNFDGWYDNSKFDGNAISKIETGSIGDKVFYAKWNAKEYEISYELYGGVNDIRNVNGNGKYVYTVLSEDLQLFEPEKAGYEFVRWKDDDNNTVTVISAENPRSFKIYAVWNVITYSISYELNGGTSAANMPETYDAEDGIIELPLPVRNGYDFDGWFDSVSDTKYEEITPDNELRDIVLSAVWSIKTFNLRYYTDGGINNSGNPLTYNVESSLITLNAPEKSGYEFVGWYDNESMTGDKITSIEPVNELRDIELYAKWEIVVYTVTYYLNGGTNNVNNPTTYTVNDGIIELSAPQKDGYDFIGWYSNENFDGDIIDRINSERCEDVSLYAKYSQIPAKPFTVEIIDGKNIITGYNYDLGTDVTIPDEVDGVHIDGIADGVLELATTVTIEAAWSEINTNAFLGCNVLESLILPDTLISIPSGLLADCVALSSLTVPYVGLEKYSGADGVYYPLSSLFGNSAKNGCYSVNERVATVSGGTATVTQNENDIRYVPEALKEIIVKGGNVVNYALSGLSFVNSIKFTGDTKRIETCAMRECTALSVVEFSADLENLNSTALYDCVNLTTVKAYDGVVNEMITSAVSKAVGADNVGNVNVILL